MSRSRKNRSSLFVLGRGRLGSAVAVHARRAGYLVVGSWSRSSRLALPKRIDADLVALAVPEGALFEVARQLIPHLAPGSIVFHFGGSVDLSPLRELRNAGFEVGSLHPYCSISDARTSLRGASCAIEGTPRARRELRRLADALGLRPLTRALRDRPRYHLSAGLLIAATLGAASRSEEALVRTGLSRKEARRTLAGFLRSIAANLERLGPLASLSGPLARGERRRLATHLALLEDDPGARRLYRAAADVLMSRKPPRPRATAGRR
jgi:predicted short-subunit dehydrogenase-like oxidoreductase (DUF2520 family)